MYTFQGFDLGLIKRMFFTPTEEPREAITESRDELLARLEREYDNEEDSSD